MIGIHEFFPPDDSNSKDPISEKKLAKVEGRYSTQKMLLGFDFDGKEYTMWLEAAKQEKLPMVFNDRFEQVCKGPWVSRSMSLNQHLQSFDMPLRASPQELDFSPYAIGSS
jgi:hypothetical protein